LCALLLPRTRGGAWDVREMNVWVGEGGGLVFRGAGNIENH